MYETLSWYNELAIEYNYDNGSYTIPICEIRKSDSSSWVLERFVEGGSYQMIRIESRALYITTFVKGMCEVIELLNLGF